MDESIKRLLRSNFRAEQDEAEKRQSLMLSVNNSKEAAFWEGYKSSMRMGIKIVNEAPDRLTFINKTHDYVHDISNRTVMGTHDFIMRARRFQEGETTGLQVVLATFQAI